MKRIYYIIIIAAMAAAQTGCKGSKQSSSTPSPYERKPLVEVSQAQLDLDSRLIDALSLQESGHTDEALEAYASLSAADPGCAAAWYGMGRLLLQRGWTDSATACAERAVRLQGANVWYRLLLVQANTRRGDHRAVASDWETIVKQNPDVLDYYYELSNAYITIDDIPSAVEALNRVERKIGVTEPISLQKQRLWEAAGKHDKAMREVEALSEAMPEGKRYHSVLAEMNMQQKNYAKAKQYYDRILAADPDDQYIHLQLAEYYKRTGKPAEADREMLQAFENKQLSGKTKLQLLGSFYSNEEFFGSRRQTTFRLLDMAMADCADSTEYALFYGDVLMRQEKYAEAARQFEVALQQDSSRYPVWEALLICLTEVPGSTNLLEDRARRATRLFPTHTLPRYLVASCLFSEGGRYAEALQQLESAAKWGFNKGYLEVECHALMAECCYQLGRYDEAWAHFDRSLELQPDNWGILNNYAYYLAGLGLQLDKAEQMSRRTVEAEPRNANNLDTYAWILHLLHRDREALPYMEQAIRLDPDSETLRLHLQTIRNTLGQ